MIDPQPDFQPAVGVAEQLSPGLRRLLAPNASPMTYRGTNTYLLGESEVAVIDPGPLDDAHLSAILEAGAGRISHILVTHAHLDHSPLARVLAGRTGAPVYGFGPATAGRSPLMQELADSGLVGGGEGVDLGFAPDVLLADGDCVSGADWQVTALHTPGHMSGHLAFAWGNVLFSGDLVMGWATSLVSPPDGDLSAFMASLRRLQSFDWSVFHAGHGAPVTEPAERLKTLLTHRQGREAEILETLRLGADTPAGLAGKIYTGTPSALLPAASRNVLAHLIALTEENLVSPIGPLRSDARFHLVEEK
ncbi:MBL fold metallo-hydrolase [Tropicibacter naphthalenivorans]|uniref:Hydroxyacylglutathione hydrolase n=1 Tax=Tropicibacter naphthalenivorans TaxID=441103 RepID=A0A0P1GTW0_9RHOB|nr:MBL fold metallo-hydrolase [Tropicibacter naphthalenivorans]CUH77504.1 hydroxyacylglutathione hydrolase [Tropicibacter naphthalenivorans]SMC56759.1 Glyoxylase, beta-lactamase superfamily II [Tropicibacter naphthalenivorans]